MATPGLPVEIAVLDRPIRAVKKIESARQLDHKREADRVHELGAHAVVPEQPERSVLQVRIIPFQEPVRVEFVRIRENVWIAVSS